MERDTVISRIRKLLALGSDGANAKEATSAVLMAQQLIAKYGIADDEVHDGDGLDPAICGIETEPLVTAKYWRWYLAHLIADNFRCKVYESYAWEVSMRTDRYIKRKKFTFYGYEQDAQAASLAFTYLYRTGNRLAGAVVRDLKRRGRSVNGAFNSYITGFLLGLRSELERQSMELMVVMPLAVREKYEAEVASCLTTSPYRELSCDYRRKSLIEKGRDDGRDAVRSRRLEDTHDFALCG